LNSTSWTEQYDSLLQKLSLRSTELLNFQKEIKIDMDEFFQDISNIWHETNNAFTEKSIQLKQARDEIKSYLQKVSI
jgi:hypothetical protein